MPRAIPDISNLFRQHASQASPGRIFETETYKSHNRRYSAPPPRIAAKGSTLQMQRPGVKAPSYTILSLSDDDGENTIVYGPKLKALYWVETAAANMDEFKLYEHNGDTCISPDPATTVTTVVETMKATRVFRSGEGGKRDLIASFVFCPHDNTSSGSGTITFASSETYQVGDFFRRKSPPST